MEKLINSLKKLGLSRYEAQAYIGLNKIITGQANEIAEISSIPRSRIYDILKGLEEKGFVEVERGRPSKYKAVHPTTIISDEKEKLVEELDNTENKLKKIYNKDLSEIQAPVWLIHSQDNIIKREVEIIKNSRKKITIRIGFLLEGEGRAMLKAFNEISRDVEIRIIANPVCYINDEKIDIIEMFKKSRLNNLEIIAAELPMMKLLISDEKEIFGTFTHFTGENDSIIPETAFGVNNKYKDICQNFDKHFIKQFEQLKSMK